jgi:signal peptidase I
MSYDPAGPSETPGPFAEREPAPDITDSEPAADPWTAGSPGSAWRPDRQQPDAYSDVPASLELGASPEDIGLGPRAYDRTVSYERLVRRRRGARGRKVVRELVETVILALLIFFAVRAVVQNFRVEGASMEPSMHNNEYLLVNKAIYYRIDLGRLNDIVPFLPFDGDGERHLFRAPRRGDIIVFRFPLDPDRDFIKRVIGVPGDTVEVRDEKVFVNGVPLTEDYILATPNYNYGPRVVPEGMYFVLGDNRRNSFDSHTWGSGCNPQQMCDFVPEENIIGQAWITYWPFDELGLINNKDIKIPSP